jgi:hypothetical protein
MSLTQIQGGRTERAWSKEVEKSAGFWREGQHSYCWAGDLPALLAELRHLRLRVSLKNGSASERVLEAGCKFLVQLLLFYI